MSETAARDMPGWMRPIPWWGHLAGVLMVVGVFVGCFLAVTHA